jgi:Icc-related predicted phosphoesterase
MNTKDFLRLGVPLGQATRRATDFVAKFILGGGDKSRLHAEVAAIVANPSAFLEDDLRRDFAKALLNAPPPPRAVPVKYHQWGEGLDHEAVMQMERACLLFQFATDNQPLLGCSGHIHESPYQTGGKWIARVGKTVWLQPGQIDFKLHYVTMEIAGDFFINSIRHSIFGDEIFDGNGKSNC